MSEHQHSLIEHLQSVEQWWLLNIDGFRNYTEDQRLQFFTAYERWLNDRPLLTDEDPSQVADDRRRERWAAEEAEKLGG